MATKLIFDRYSAHIQRFAIMTQSPARSMAFCISGFRVNSLVPRKCSGKIESVIFKCCLLIDILATMRIAQIAIDRKIIIGSSDVHVSVGNRSSCGPKSMSPYDVTRSKWFNTLGSSHDGRHYTNDILKFMLLFNVFPNFESTTLQHRFKEWIGAESNKPLSEPMMT